MTAGNQKSTPSPCTFFAALWQAWTRTAGCRRPDATARSRPPMSESAELSAPKGAAPARRSRKAKLSHLFLVRGNPNHERLWEEFFAGGEDNFRLYVHPKWPQKLSRLFRQRVVADVAPRPTIISRLWRRKSAFLPHGDGRRRKPVLPSALGELYSDPPFFAGLRGNNGAGNKLVELPPREHVALRASSTGRVPERHFYKASQFFCLSLCARGAGAG